MNAPLERFVEAQRPVYGQALVELRGGAKRGHWMWFIFPQIAGLGHSEMARRFALADVAEARAYLRHEVLGTRLRECAEAILPWARTRSATDILGPVDALKLRSSMTLFEAAASGGVGGSEPFAAVLEAFYAGERDPRTLQMLENPEP